MPISIKLNIDEGDQMDSFQNATISSACEGVVVSIAVYPNYPKSICSQEDVKAYLAEHLSSLSNMGWGVEVQVGSEES